MIAFIGLASIVAFVVFLFQRKWIYVGTSVIAFVICIANTPSHAQSRYSGYTASSDMETVRTDRGRPCHVSTTDTAQGHIEIWSYDCIGGMIGKESFTFVNGKQFSHTQI
jgi:hypothetical protein